MCYKNMASLCWFLLHFLTKVITTETKSVSMDAAMAGLAERRYWVGLWEVYDAVFVKYDYDKSGSLPPPVWQHASWKAW